MGCGIWTGFKVCGFLCFPVGIGILGLGFGGLGLGVLGTPSMPPYLLLPRQPGLRARYKPDRLCSFLSSPCLACLLATS